MPSYYYKFATRKLAKHKLSRRMDFRGLKISIETDKGELRHWYNPHNKEKGYTKMTNAYGYIRRTEGVDGDHVDVYVGPHLDAPFVYIVHQMKAPDFTEYDEDKCMLGFRNAKEAKAAYLANFNDGGFFGTMDKLPFESFKVKVMATFNNPKKVTGQRLKSAEQAYRVKVSNAMTSALVRHVPVHARGEKSAAGRRISSAWGLAAPAIGIPVGLGAASLYTDKQVPPPPPEDQDMFTTAKNYLQGIFGTTPPSED